MIVIRVLETGDFAKPQQYIALSYCWGAGVQKPVELRDDTKLALLAGVSANNLVKTHREAIQFTQAFGVRYLWVDALCIIQGDQEDWERESKSMALIYGNAVLVLIAGRANDCRNGFIDNDLSVSPVARRCGSSLMGVDDTGRDLGPVYISFPRVLAKGPVSDRGWCFQESMLARRSICFGQEQISFCCKFGVQWEDGNGYSGKSRGIQTRYQAGCL